MSNGCGDVHDFSAEPPDWQLREMPPCSMNGSDRRQRAGFDDRIALAHRYIMSVLATLPQLSCAFPLVPPNSAGPDRSFRRPAQLPRRIDLSPFERRHPERKDARSPGLDQSCQFQDSQRVPVQASRMTAARHRGRVARMLLGSPIQDHKADLRHPHPRSHGDGGSSGLRRGRG